eukprot:7357543-Pyramimonas_sp.AAC.1
MQVEARAPRAQHRPATSRGRLIQEMKRAEVQGPRVARNSLTLHSISYVSCGPAAGLRHLRQRGHDALFYPPAQSRRVGGQLGRPKAPVNTLPWLSSCVWAPSQRSAPAAASRTVPVTLVGFCEGPSIMHWSKEMCRAPV